MVNNFKKLVLVLDPAHGEDVAGKRSPDGTHREYDWSRRTLKQLEEKLVELDYKVYWTSSNKNEIGLDKRCKNCNSIKEDNKFLISLHNDASKNGEWGSATGYSVYTSKGQTTSDKYADVIFTNLRLSFPNLKFRLDQTDGDYDKEENFYILKNTLSPSILLEWLFQDTKSDLEIIKNPESTSKLVDTLVLSIEQINKLII